MERRTRLLLFANVGLWVAAIARAVQSRGEWEPGKMPLGWDLAVFRTASRMWQAGLPLYDFAEQARVHASLYGEGRDAYPFAYPPLLAMEALPLAAVPHFVALAILTTASVGVLALVVRRLGLPARELLWVTASFPGFYALLAGQLSYLALGAFAASYLLLRAARPLAAGLVLSLLVFKPQLLVMAPLVFAFDRKRARGLVGLAGGALAQLGLCWVFAPEATRAFPRALATFADHASERFKGSLSFTWRAFFAGLLPQSLATPLAIGALLACAALFVRWIWAARADLERSFALVVLATFACAWHCAPYDWVILALPALLVLPRVRLSSAARVALIAGAIGLWLVVPFVDAQQRTFGIALHPAPPMLLAFAAWLRRAPLRDRTS